MNIHIEEEEFDWLMDQPRIGRFTIGSKLYNLHDRHSDTDYLVITYPFFNLTNSPFSNHHQFQYKDRINNIDYNFVDVVTFIKNLVSGDSTVNYELLHSEEFKANAKIGWLCDYVDSFTTYNIIKSYLGLADRDIRHFNKKVGRDKVSAMMHIQRGFDFAVRMLYDEFKLDMYSYRIDKDEKFIPEFERNLSKLREKIKTFRQDELNSAYERKEIPRYLDTKIQMEINNELIRLLTERPDTFIKDSLFKKIAYSNENIEMKYEKV
jgi:hypothetical protein